MDRRYHQRDGPHYNHGNRHGYPEFRQAENVNYGSSYQFIFGHPGSYNVNIDGNRHQIPSPDQLLATGNSYPGVPNQGGSFTTPPPQSAFAGHSLYSQQHHQQQQYPGNSMYTAPISNGLHQSSYIPPFNNIGPLPGFSLGNRPPMPPNQPINHPNMFQSSGNHGCNHSGNCGPPNGFLGSTSSRLASRNQSQNHANNRSCDSHCSSTDLDDDDDEVFASSQESLLRRGYPNCP